MFLGIVNLSQAYPLFAIVAAILQYLQVKMIMPSTANIANNTPGQKQAQKFNAMMRWQSLYIMPVFTALIFGNCRQRLDYIG